MKLLFILGLFCLSCIPLGKEGANSKLSNPANKTENIEKIKLYHICKLLIESTKCFQETLEVSSKENKEKLLIHCSKESFSKEQSLKRNYKISSVEDYLLTLDPEVFNEIIKKSQKTFKELSAGYPKIFTTRETSAKNFDHEVKLIIELYEEIIDALDCHSEFDF